MSRKRKRRVIDIKLITLDIQTSTKETAAFRIKYESNMRLRFTKQTPEFSMAVMLYISNHPSVLGKNFHKDRLDFGRAKIDRESACLEDIWLEVPVAA